jgi:hypothetical protein
MLNARTILISLFALVCILGCPNEDPEEPCAIDCSRVEYCGNSACDVCPELCTTEAPPQTDAGQNNTPATSDAGQDNTPATSDAGQDNTPATSDAGQNNMTATSDAGQSLPPNVTDAGATPSFSCGTFNVLKKSWGGSSGPCGPRHSVTIHENGNVTQSSEDAYPPEGATACADAAITNMTADALLARALLDTVCEDFQANYAPIQETCVGAYTYWSFLQDETQRDTTSNMSCGNNSMSVSDAAHDTFMASLNELLDSGN